MTAIVQSADASDAAAAIVAIDAVNAVNDKIISWTVGSKLFVAKK